jgi:hypothetical protein
MKKTVFAILFSVAFSVAGYAQREQVWANFSPAVSATFENSYQTAKGSYRLKSVIKADETQLLVLDAQGKTLSETKVNQRIYKDKAQSSFAFTASQLVQKQDGLYLHITEAEHNVVPKIEAGIKSTYRLTAEGTWEKIDEKTYREKIIAR